jgi:hypothetical protein
LAVGGDALAAVAVDGVVTPTVLAKLRELPDITDVRVVQLG